MLYRNIYGVPDFECTEYAGKTKDYVLLIPIINEGERIARELSRAKEHGISAYADIVICDGGSTDGCTDEARLRALKLRMGIYWALQRGYSGVITIDGNDKDSIEDVPRFIEKLRQGYDLVQGSRFIKGGRAINTPLSRFVAVKLIHAPITSLTAHQRFTDTTNAYRAYSARYLRDGRVMPLRDVFMTYELLAYLSVRATQLGYKACEIPVTRAYPAKGKTPTKISPLRGNAELMKILLLNAAGRYRP